MCVDYCSTYFKAVREGGGKLEDMCFYERRLDLTCAEVCVFVTAGPITKLFARGSGGHVLRETTSRGLCELVCPSRTSERGGEGSRTSERGGEGYCVKEGGGEEGERERERAGKVRLHYSLGHWH